MYRCSYRKKYLMSYVLTYSAQPGRRTAQPGGVGRGVARVHVDGMTCSKCVNYIQAMPYNPQQDSTLYCTCLH
jgi:hypothetical protein